MVRLIKKDRGNYTNTCNQVIRDSRLTWKARGIFNYLWSQADKWQFYVAEVAQHAKDGVKSTRNGLDELEQFGYLKRVNRHDTTGSFDGMDWILSDTGGLNDESSVKESQVDSEDHRHDHFGDDAEKAQKKPISCQKGSDAKQVRRKKGPTQNGTLRNNNNKNYQDKELSTNKKSSSSKPSSSNDEIKDPFAEQQDDDDEKIVNGLIGMFLGEARISGPAPYEREHIKRQLLKMGRANAIDFMYTMINKISTSSISDPIAYLERSLMNAKGGETNG